MKKACIYLLLLLMAANTTELHQLFKVPVLFQHFAEHKERNNRVSLLKFLSMHYWGDDNDDNDNDRDMELPFKKLDVHQGQLQFLPNSRTLSIKSYHRPFKKPYALYTHQFVPNPDVSAPFRPPCA